MVLVSAVAAVVVHQGGLVVPDAAVLQDQLLADSVAAKNQDPGGTGLLVMAVAVAAVRNKAGWNNVMGEGRGAEI